MRQNHAFAAAGLVVLLVGALAAPAFVLGPPDADDGTGDDPADWRTENATVETFDSEEQFRDYLSRAQSDRGTSFGGGMAAGDVAVEETDEAAMEDSATSADGAADSASAESGGSGGSAGADRYAETNVQVEGIDEPDLLKTDGRSVFYAGRGHQQYTGTRVLNATEPADPQLSAEVPETGKLLLANDTLLVLQDDEIHGFDVSDRENPQRAWTKPLDGRLETARLRGGDVYLVVAERAGVDDPCPVEPLGGDGGVDVACSDVHYSPNADGADTTYSVVRLDPSDGEVEDAASFVGASGRTVTYVSSNAVYLTYPDSPSQADVRMDFLLGPGSDVLDQQAIDELERLRGYELSDQARQAEIRSILDQWRARLDEDERRNAERELDEKFANYTEEHLREFQSTGIVRVDTNGSLDVSATGKVPGRPLNQFSLDEHEGNLRIATTVEAPRVESQNDLYVLDGELDVVGEVQGMAPGQRIYSVRYVGDEAYLVTFKRIDPFHTVDLSDPENPEELGEVKLPGFSTYLHPLSEDRILGIGREDGEVKAVTFDISDRENPVVEDDAILDARWSAVAESHHAFLLDEKHGVFFLPTDRGGYVYGYENGLERKTVVETDGPAVRATYLDDYLYVFAEDELVVVDETSWEEERRVDL